MSPDAPPTGSLSPVAFPDAPSSPPPPRTGRLRRLGAWALAAGAVLLSVSVRRAEGPAPRAHRPVVVVSGTATPRTEAGHPERWAGHHGITITLDPTLDALDGTAKDAVKRSVSAWLGSGAALPQVAFASDDEPGAAGADGTNRVLVAPISVPGHEKDVAITISQVDDATGEILEADVVLNATYAFAVLDRPTEDDSEAASCDHHAYDVENVMTHELGHFFGLGEDMEDREATMYVVSSPCQTHKRALTGADTSEMTSLYQTPLPGAATNGAPQVGAPAGGCGGGAATATR